MPAPQISLYGYIPNPNCGDPEGPLYILREIQLSPTEYRYEGRIGHGLTDLSEHDASDVIDTPGFPCKYIPVDMRELNFIFNTETNQIIIDTYWRYEVNEKEAHSLIKNYESDHVDTDEDSHISYPYFRFPRSKDGIAISRALNFIFKDKDIKIFIPKKHLG